MVGETIGGEIGKEGGGEVNEEKEGEIAEKSEKNLEGRRTGDQEIIDHAEDGADGEKEDECPSQSG